ncbi:MAG: DUF4469 domain-containing protein [Leptospiraceae bacterium]|nr:DUF4469 domain-containing protein [Leptospiraceae bacterium]
MKFQIESHLTPQGKKTFIAKSQASGILSEEEIYRKMGRNSEILTIESKKYIQLFYSVLLESLRKGYAVQTPMGKFTPQLAGTFNSIDDRYSPKRHKIRVSFQAKKDFLLSIQDSIKPKKVASQKRKPIIQEITNASRSNTKVFKTNDLILISGENLKIHTKHPETKLELIQQTKGKPAKVIPIPIQHIPVHEHRKILFQLPLVPKGTYTVRVTALVGRKVMETETQEKIVVG